MARKLLLMRLVVLGTFLCACGVALTAWLYQLQIVDHSDLSKKSAKNTKMAMALLPRRGDIKDVHGQILATSVPVKTVYADPTLIGVTNQLLVVRTLAPLLHTNESWLADRLQMRTRQISEKITNYVDGKVVVSNTNYFRTNRYVVLKHKVPLDEWQSITQAMNHINPDWADGKLSDTQKNLLVDLRTHAIASAPDHIRVYPNRTLASHVIGSVISQEIVMGDFKMMAIAGAEGIELKYNTVMRGIPGWRQTEADKDRKELVPYREHDIPAREGYSVVLTLDARLQDIVESAIADAVEKHHPQGICSVMIRPKTGEILAMASLPNFDPNYPGHSPMESHRNLLISWQPEPGSTFKIVVVSGALNDHLVTLDDRFDCENGHFVFAGRLLHDHVNYGLLSVEQIIQKSSNIGAAKIGIKMGKQELYRYIKAFGFGDLSGITLPGEEVGMTHHQTNWTPLSISRIPMGHEIANTPLQMAMAMSAIANGGKLMKPIIVDHLEDEQGTVVEKAQPRVVREVIRPETAALMVKALKTVVGPQGTAAKAAMENYVVAGKTGTAQKVIPGGYSKEKFISSFIGFFPADDPEICISVVLDSPVGGYYGGEVAAPTFKRIAEQAANYLNIKPAPEQKIGANSNTAQSHGRLARVGTLP